MYLDHVALATRDAQPTIDTLVAELGGTLITGGILVRPVDGTNRRISGSLQGRMPREPCYTHARLGGVAQLVRAAES